MYTYLCTTDYATRQFKFTAAAHAAEMTLQAVWQEAYYRTRRAALSAARQVEPSEAQLVKPGASFPKLPES
jgi:hypothetical protein